MSISAWAPWDPRIPSKWFFTLWAAATCTNRRAEWVRKPSETQSGDWYQGRYIREWCKALKTCSPEDVAGNGREWLRWTELVAFLPLEWDKIPHAFIELWLYWIMLEIGLYLLLMIIYLEGWAGESVFTAKTQTTPLITALLSQSFVWAK